MTFFLASQAQPSIITCNVMLIGQDIPVLANSGPEEYCRQRRLI